MYLDEFTNEQLPAALAGEFKETPAIRAEAKRVDELITQLVLTGADLRYWVDRRAILRSTLMHHSCRETILDDGAVCPACTDRLNDGLGI